MCTATTAGSNLAPEQDPGDDQYTPQRVTICHRSTSRTKPYVTVTVRRTVLPAHLRHGDTVGPCVYGSVKSGGVVSLRTHRGAPIVQLKARRLYSIVVNDLSGAENFHLFGNRVDRLTGIGFRGTVRWKVTFASGRYVYRSDAHPGLRRLVTAR